MFRWDYTLEGNTVATSDDTYPTVIEALDAGLDYLDSRGERDRPATVDATMLAVVSEEHDEYDEPAFHAAWYGESLPAGTTVLAWLGNGPYEGFPGGPPIGSGVEVR